MERIFACIDDDDILNYNYNEEIFFNNITNNNTSRILSEAYNMYGTSKLPPDEIMYDSISCNIDCIVKVNGKLTAYYYEYTTQSDINIGIDQIHNLIQNSMNDDKYVDDMDGSILKTDYIVEL